MGTFGDSWTLTKTAFRMIKEDKALLIFPLVSGLSALGILAMFVVGLFSIMFWAHLTGTTFQVVMGVLSLVIYFVLWIVSVYFTGALMGAARMKLEGGQPKFHDGMVAARARAGKLVAWALISGTIMLVIRAIAARFRGITGALIGIAAGATWGAATYFIIPVLMFEEQGAWASFKRSGSLFVHTFGKTMISNLAMALILGAGFVGGILLLFGGVLLMLHGLFALGIVLLVAGLAVIVFMAILSSAAEGVLRVALYCYGTTGRVTNGLIPPQYLGAVRSSSGGLTYGGAPPPPPLPPMARPLP